MRHAARKRIGGRGARGAHERGRALLDLLLQRAAQFRVLGLGRRDLVGGAVEDARQLGHLTTALDLQPRRAVAFAEARDDCVQRRDRPYHKPVEQDRARGEQEQHQSAPRRQRACCRLLGPALGAAALRCAQRLQPARDLLARALEDLAPHGRVLLGLSGAGVGQDAEQRVDQALPVDASFGIRVQLERQVVQRQGALLVGGQRGVGAEADHVAHERRGDGALVGLGRTQEQVAVLQEGSAVRRLQHEHARRDGQHEQHYGRPTDAREQAQRALRTSSARARAASGTS